MKKCLFITTQFPYPLDNGGKIGAFNGLSVVSANYDVTVLSFSEEMQYIREGVKYYKEKLPNVHFYKVIEHNIHIRKKPVLLCKVMAKDYLFEIPYVTAKFQNRQMFRAIDEMFDNRNKWDVVFIDYLNMGVYQEYIQKKYKNQFNLLVLKDHNIEYEIVKQAADNEKSIKKKILDREWKITKQYEMKCISRADKVFSVCEENTKFLKKSNDSAYTMLPTFEMLPSREHPLNHNILYMGNLSWGANLDGLKWFIEKVMPLIINTIPDAKLTVVGSGPNTEFFSNYNFVDYKGYVKDISHIYDNQSVFVVPLFEGSGIRIKILEAFNNEIPVVSTTLGCDTIGAMNNKEIFVANNSTHFAKYVIELLIDSSKNKDMSYNAKKFLKRMYSLKMRQQEFMEIVDGK